MNLDSKGSVWIQIRQEVNWRQKSGLDACIFIGKLNVAEDIALPKRSKL